jgi:hypothetical protein
MNQQSGAESVLKGAEPESASALLDLVRKVLTDATNAQLEGEPGMFPMDPAPMTWPQRKTASWLHI